MLTLHYYKRHFGITSASDDVKIDSALQSAIAVAESYTNAGYTSDNSPIVKKYDTPPSWDRTILLPNVNAVVSGIVYKEMEWNEATEQFDDYTLVDGIDYFVNELGLVELTTSSFPSKRMAIEITYTPNATVPRDYCLAVYELTQYYHKREFQVEKAIAGQDVKYNDASVLPTQVKTILDLHRCL